MIVALKYTNYYNIVKIVYQYMYVIMNGMPEKGAGGRVFVDIKLIISKLIV